MPNLRIFSTNRYTATATALTASSAAAGLPAAASANPDRSYVWRSIAGTGAATMDVDLGSSLACTGIAVANVKLVGAGVLELWRGATLGAETTLVGTLPTQDRDTRTAFLFFGSQSSRYWRLKWTNPGAASDYAELGYCALGLYTELTRNIVVPADIARIDPSLSAVSVDGQETVARRTKYFAGTWAFADCDETMLGDLRSLFDSLGKHTPYFVVLDTSLAWTCWLQRSTGELGTGLSVMAGRYNVRLPWAEVR